MGSRVGGVMSVTSVPTCHYPRFSGFRCKSLGVAIFLKLISNKYLLRILVQRRWPKAAKSLPPEKLFCPMLPQIYTNVALIWQRIRIQAANQQRGLVQHMERPRGILHFACWVCKHLPNPSFADSFPKACQTFVSGFLRATG